jgi:hypothetical protein
LLCRCAVPRMPLSPPPAMRQAQPKMCIELSSSFKP